MCFTRYLVDCFANPWNFRTTSHRPPSPSSIVYLSSYNLQLRNCEAEKLRNACLSCPASMNLIVSRAMPNSTRDNVEARIICIMRIISRWKGQLGIMTCTVEFWFFVLYYKRGRILREWILWTALSSSARGKRRIFRLRYINLLVSFFRIPETFMR